MLIGNKKGALQEYLWGMAPTVIAKRIYCQELIVKAFQFFATSRSLFNRPRIDCQLQCLKSIIRITSKVSTSNETYLMSGVFKTVEENQTQCLIIIDEIYVEKCCFMGGLCLEERLMILNPLQKLY